MRRILATAAWWSSVLLTSSLTTALEVSNTAQIKDSSKAIANRLVALYPSVQADTWWEGGAIFGGLLDYSGKTGDTSFNDLVAQQIAEQAGAGPYFLPPTVSPTVLTTYGQARWGLTAILADEVGFPRNPALPVSYLDLAQGAFDEIAARWDNWTCAGGFNTSFYASTDPSKDAFSVGEFFQLAARLAMRTKDGKYTVWANRVYEWANRVGLLQQEDDALRVYNSIDPLFNCSRAGLDTTLWSVNAGAFLYGSVLMYNVTNQQSWVSRSEDLLHHINSTFFTPTVSEPSCKRPDCTFGQRLYRALLLKFVAKSGVSARFITSDAQKMLIASGRTIAAGCTNPLANGGNSTCNVDGATGVPEQLIALNSLVSLLIGRGKDDNETPPAPDNGTAKAGASGLRADDFGFATVFGLIMMIVVAIFAL